MSGTEPSTQTSSDAELGDYELWDDDSGNCVGAYHTLSAALIDVLGTIRLYGTESPAVLSLTLVRLDGPPEQNGLSGARLVERAMSFGNVSDLHRTAPAANGASRHHMDTTPQHRTS